MKKLAIIITHPIQYYAPLFQLLTTNAQIGLKVFYTWSQSKEVVKDKTFGKDIVWDVPLLEGYSYEFVKNISKNPGSNSWKGIDTPELNAKIEAYNPDAILVYGWNMKSHFSVLRHFKNKIPVWFRGDSTLLDHQSFLKRYLRKILLTIVYSFVDKAFYVGSANKSYFLQHGLNEKQLIYAPHAVNNMHFADSEIYKYEEQALNWKTNLGIDKEQLTVVFAGKFEDKKQPNLLIEAVKEVNTLRRDPIALILIGQGPMETKIKNLSAKDKNIHFLPFQNQSKMPLVYRLASIFCLPSKGPGETWGLAVNEAMACSRPVIVSNKVGCAGDMLINGVNGFVFDYANRNELVAILTDLKTETLKIMGENAFAHVQNFSIQQMALALETELLRTT